MTNDKSNKAGGTTNTAGTPVIPALVPIPLPIGNQPTTQHAVGNKNTSGPGVSMVNNGVSPAADPMLPPMADNHGSPIGIGNQPAAKNVVGNKEAPGLDASSMATNYVCPADLMRPSKTDNSVPPPGTQQDLVATYRDILGTAIVRFTTAPGASLVPQIRFSSMVEVKKYYTEIMRRTEEEWVHVTAEVQSEALDRMSRLPCMKDLEGQPKNKSPAFLNVSMAFYDWFVLSTFLDRASITKGYRLLTPSTTIFVRTSTPAPAPFANPQSTNSSLARVATPCRILRRYVQSHAAEKSLNEVNELRASNLTKDRTIHEQAEQIRKQEEQIRGLEEELQQVKKGLLRVAMMSTTALNPKTAWPKSQTDNLVPSTLPASPPIAPITTLELALAPDQVLASVIAQDWGLVPAPAPAPSQTLAPQAVGPATNNNNSNPPAVMAKPTMGRPQVTNNSMSMLYPRPPLTTTTTTAPVVPPLTRPSSTNHGSWTPTPAAVTASTPTPNGRNELIQQWMDETQRSVLGKRSRED